MQSTITINKRGTITIPAPMRKALGLRAHDRLIIEDTDVGLLIRPSVSVPVEMYTDDRIAEFTRDDEAIVDLLGLEKN